MKKNVKASYTIEASMVMPLILFFIFSGICTWYFFMSGSTEGIGLFYAATGIIGCRIILKNWGKLEEAREIYGNRI